MRSKQRATLLRSGPRWLVWACSSAAIFCSRLVPVAVCLAIKTLQPRPEVHLGINCIPSCKDDGTRVGEEGAPDVACPFLPRVPSFCQFTRVPSISEPEYQVRISLESACLREGAHPESTPCCPDSCLVAPAGPFSGFVDSGLGGRPVFCKLL